MCDSFQQKDKEIFARGHEQWQVMVRKTRKHLFLENWIEDTRDKMWVITDEGRRAATPNKGAQDFETPD